MIKFNTISLNFEGLRLTQSNSNTLFNNIISSNIYGIQLAGDSAFNNIYSNILFNNSEYAILISSTPFNQIRWNDFINNSHSGTSQVFEASIEGKNIIEYNYWNDWTSPDDDNDGFIDLPYFLAGTVNSYDDSPLSSPFHLSSPTLITPIGGETIKGIFTIIWLPTYDRWGHTVTYTLYYSIDDGTTWNLLITGLNSSSYNWDTRTVPDNTNYILKVVAACPAGVLTEDKSDSSFAIQNSIILPPDAPQGLTTTEGELFIFLDWNAPSNDGGSPIISYWLYRGTSTGEYSLIFITSNNFYNDTFVSGGITYYYIVTAINVAGESISSSEVTGTPLLHSSSTSTSSITLPTTTSDESISTSNSITSQAKPSSFPQIFVVVFFLCSLTIYKRKRKQN